MPYKYHATIFRIPRLRYISCILDVSVWCHLISSIFSCLGCLILNEMNIISMTRAHLENIQCNIFHNIPQIETCHHQKGVCWISHGWHIEVWTKLPQFGMRHFQTRFLLWKPFHINSISTKVWSCGSNFQFVTHGSGDCSEPIRQQVIAWNNVDMGTWHHRPHWVKIRPPFEKSSFS